MLERAVLARRPHFADDAADVEALLEVESVCVDADPAPAVDDADDDVVSDAAWDGVAGSWDDVTGAVDVEVASELVDVGTVEDPVPEAEDPLDEGVVAGAIGFVTLDAGTVTDVVTVGEVATPVDVGPAVDPTLVRDRAAVESDALAAPEFEIS